MADERKYYCYCDSNCKYETMTKEQILAAIVQAVSTGVIKDVDTGFITTVKTINDKSVKFFFGTEAEYNALGEEERANLIPYKTDDSLMQRIAEIIEDAKIGKVPRMAAIDQATIDSNAKDSERPYSKELDDILIGKDRVYVEGQNHSGVMRTFALTYDGAIVYNPWGYKSLAELCLAYGWKESDIAENTQYVIKTENGVTSYHGWLSSVVQRQFDGNIRVNTTPKDSSDAASKQYVDKYSFSNFANKSGTDEDTNAKNGYHILSFGDKAKSLYPVRVDGASSLGNSIAQRMADGALRAKMRASTSADFAASYDANTLINYEYLNHRLSSYDGKVKLNPEGGVEIPQRSAEGEMRCNMPSSISDTTVINKKYLQENALDKIADLYGILGNIENAFDEILGA